MGGGSGDCALTSIYVGGGTPTVALDGVAAVLGHARRRFRLSVDVAIETNPADVDAATAGRLRDMGVGLVSLGVHSFRARHLAAIGWRYSPADADRALSALAAETIRIPPRRQAPRAYDRASMGRRGPFRFRL